MPVVFGPIAVTYNVKGLSTLALDGPTAAKIFNGAITTWDDPAIKALNANATLPAEPIHVVFRSDQSGTTANFQEYLDAASNGAWGKGSGKTFNGGVGEGAKGNDGTSAAVKRTEGAITYNEWSFAQAQKLNMAKIVTSASRSRSRSARTRSARQSPGQRSRGRATTWCLTRCRSTSRPRPVPIRSCWRRTRSFAPNTRSPTSAPRSRRFCKLPSAPVRRASRTTGISQFRMGSSHGCRPRSTPSRNLRPSWPKNR
ncbi:phosphate-binding protein pstS 3 [Mycobacterium xenopi 3993]|nr:phosphate-binding protein pstS 3 [Mycobacterium xenopi 3993]